MKTIYNMKKMKKVIYPVFVATLFIGCGQQQESISDEGKSLKVKVEVVKTLNGTSELQYSGTIEASQTIPLTFQTTGLVEKVYVDEGDEVKKGQLLATVDKSDLQNIFDAALSKYKQAKDAYDRLKTVHKQGSLPEIKWVEMVTNLEQAKSSMELSKNNLDKCNMRAPENGVIGQRNIEPGQASIGVSSSPIELVIIETVMVKVSVPENEISKIKKGIKANFRVSALNDKQFDGIVTNISPVADAISRTYNVKITVKNSGLELMPGMVCDVKLNLKSEKEIVIIPYNAITTDEHGKPFVFVVSTNNKTVKKHEITTGNYHESGIEVIGGLNIGETIVVEGKEKLSDNSLISL
jgi:membrane fusion protein, multidrug efflux system